ncbi:MAG: PEGA domain-containing protein [Bdellovibrionota bacterium]
MKRCVAVVLGSLLLSGCATLFGDKDRSVRVESKPSGATVLLNGMPYGKTPTILQLTNMLSSNMVMLKLDGYEEVTRPVTTSIQPIAFLNLINIICWGIDLATGNVMKVDTKVISVDLDKKSATIETDKGIFTVDLNNPTSCKRS